MIALVGEQFTNSTDISGAVVSIRKAADRISIWTKSFNDSGKTMKSGYVVLYLCISRITKRIDYFCCRHEFKQYLGIPAIEKIQFQAHSDTAAKSSSSGYVSVYPLNLTFLAH